MNAQEYLQQELEKCSTYELRDNDNEVLEKEGIEAFIFKKITSKKFRKYSATPELLQHIQEAIKLNVANNQPINITFLRGAYKLWRLDEAPLSEWAELFAVMYYTNWLKPICEVYKPGVWFDFFVDDLIVPILNNVNLEDVKAYTKSFQEVLDFMKKYQRENMRMTITGVGDQFESPEAFYKKLDEDVDKYAATFPQGLPELTEDRAATIELNIKPTDELQKDPKWREKNVLVHDAYIKLTKFGTGYHMNRPDKILAFTQPLPSGITLSVGTSKTSIAKFWVSVGVLEKTTDGYIQYIFSPKQLESKKFTKEKIDIGLRGKNFETIRIFSN